MPDISGTAAAVQTQLRDAYATLQRRVSSPTSITSARAVAYGDMGRLFFATEYLDAAETCFLNAQTLEPNDMRWPYFLAHVHRRRNELAKAAALFERVLALEPDNVPALIWLGDMRLVEGRPDAGKRRRQARPWHPRERAGIGQSGRAITARLTTRLSRDCTALEIQPQAWALSLSAILAYRGLGDVRNADALASFAATRGTGRSAIQGIGALLQNASAAERPAPCAGQLGGRAVAASPGDRIVARQRVPHLNLGTALSKPATPKRR
jgi:tetratricopeptide (TPR) repeat protein